MRARSIAIIASCGLAVGCDREAPPAPTADADVTPAAATTAPATRSAVPRIVFLGDSLTAGLGVERDQAYPALIDEQLKSAGLEATIVNAGVSGDTTAGGLRRLDWLLKQKPAIVVVGLGGNDGLRGLDVDASAANLRQIIERSKSAGADVLLLGMLIPTNYGPEYRQQFAAMYGQIAKEQNVPLVPFVLEGVGGVPELNQPDGIHPTADGHKVVARNVIAALRPLVEKGRATTRP